LLLALPTIATPEQQPHHERADQPQVLAPGYSALKFPAPAARSYALPSLGEAADGVLLEAAHWRHSC
jgi:cytochrome c peroxidase